MIMKMMTTIMMVIFLRMKKMKMKTMPMMMTTMTIIKKQPDVNVSTPVQQCRNQHRCVYK